MRKITPFVIAAVFSIFFLQPKTANAVTTGFNFTGTCSFDCTGTATATLVLQNYTIGNTFDGTNFVSFAYHSSILNITVGAANFGGATGRFVSLPGGALVGLTFTAVFPPNPSTQLGEFDSLASGFWCIGPFGCAADGGIAHVWSVAPAVPLPAALPLFATGLGALGLLGWRRKRKAAALAA